MPGTTTTADFKANLATARATYAYALTMFVNALIDLEALTLTVNNVTGSKNNGEPEFGGAKGYWPDLHVALEHPIAAPRNVHASLKNLNLDHAIRAAQQGDLAQWSGS